MSDQYKRRKTCRKTAALPPPPPPAEEVEEKDLESLQKEETEKRTLIKALQRFEMLKTAENKSVELRQRLLL